jgi:hypothetical protein
MNGARLFPGHLGEKSFDENDERSFPLNVFPVRAAVHRIGCTTISGSLTAGVARRCQPRDRRRR